MTLLALADLALLLLATLRLVRLVLTDDLGRRALGEPIERFLWSRARAGRLPAWFPGGMTCPFCIGFWVGALVLASLALVGGPGADGTAAVLWRYVAGALALNWIAAHVGARMGDAGYADDEDEDR